MKNYVFRRLTTTLLALIMMASLFAVCVVAEETTSWDYKALLTADDGINMEGTYPPEEELTAEVPGALQVDVAMNSSEYLFLIDDFVADEITLVEGHQLRSVMRTYMPKGNVGHVCHRAYLDGNFKVLDDYASQFSDVMTDETYGYQYQESYVNITVTAEQAGTHNNLKLYVANPGNPNYSVNPFQFFSWELIDVTDGNKVLFSYDAQDFIDAGSVAHPSKCTYNPLYRDYQIGITAVDGGPYVCFDMYSYPGQTKPVQEDDILQLNIKIWKPEGWLDLQPFTASLDYYPNAISDPEDIHKEPLFSIAITSEDQYDELETCIDETYGYEYKLVTIDHVVTAEEAEKINAKRINPLIGSTSSNYADSPLTLYGCSVYNFTQDYYYSNLDGSSILSGGSNTTNESISIRRYDNSYATAGAVKAKRNATFDTLTVASDAVGQYGYTFDVKGEAGKIYVLKAYALDEESKTTQIGQKTFTATGEQESVRLLFNLREAYAGQNLCFGIEAAEAALSVNTVKYDGRIGDCAQNDEYENLLLANPVIEMINELPDTIALTDEEDIVAARAAYDALESNIQALVNNLDKLTKAETDLAALKADKAKADEVVAMIDALPAEVTAADEENVKSAREAYDALTEPQKAMVTNLAKLEAAEAVFAIVYGDINGDGNINAADALMALQHSVELITIEGNAFTAADVNEDGKVDATDALCILQFSVELIDTLPVK